MSLSPTEAVRSKFTERRKARRYKFNATIEFARQSSQSKKTDPATGYVRDLGDRGCFVSTTAGLTVGESVSICIDLKSECFRCEARVAYSTAHKGIGLMFTVIKPEDLGVLENWLATARGNSWIQSNRRRSQRVVIKIPVQVSNELGSVPIFKEDTHTVIVNAYGASVVLSAAVATGQRLVIQNRRTGDAMECVVISQGAAEMNTNEVGLEFVIPNESFWHIKFPPAQ
jgi:hypothetical protein